MPSKAKKYTAKDGTVSWQITYDLPPDPLTGKRRQKRATAPTKRDVEARMIEDMARIQSGHFVDPTKQTVGPYLLHWLEGITSTVRPATVRNYRHVITHRLAPALGSHLLSHLTALQIQRYYSDRIGAGDAPATVRLDHCLLNRALGQAVRWRVIPRNACDDVDPPRPARPESTTWIADQAAAFVAGAADHHLAALFRLSLTSGARLGEICAARWADLDLDQGRWRVQRTLTRDEAGRYVVGEPKSAAGRRIIILDPATVAALRRHKAQQNARRLPLGPDWLDLDLVFDRGDGGQRHPTAVAETFKRVAARLGLPRIRFHDLRHTSLTLLIDAGIDARTVADRAGHSTITMTLSRYVSVTPTMQRRAADALAGALTVHAEAVVTTM